jgi:D-tyrosyl-tRNA(Tyr) deacylase
MPSPTEVIKKKKVAFGHMIPNYFLNSYKECIDMIMKKEDVKYAYLDKKAIKKQGFVLSEIRKELSDREIEEIESKSLPSI